MMQIHPPRLEAAREPLRLLMAVSTIHTTDVDFVKQNPDSLMSAVKRPWLAHCLGSLLGLPELSRGSEDPVHMH